MHLLERAVGATCGGSREGQSVVDQAIDHGYRDDVIAEHLLPVAEGLLAGHDEAGACDA
jgi:hypothetical protein